MFLLHRLYLSVLLSPISNNRELMSKKIINMCSPQKKANNAIDITIYFIEKTGHKNIQWVSDYEQTLLAILGKHTHPHFILSKPIIKAQKKNKVNFIMKYLPHLIF